MDPQQRLLLEVAWEALEDAGQPAGAPGGQPDRRLRRHAHQRLLVDAVHATPVGPRRLLRARARHEASWPTGCRTCSICAGPSLAVDTACSLRSGGRPPGLPGLRNGECDLALAGGVNLMLSPLWSVALSKLGMLSPDGRCKTFDAARRRLRAQRGLRRRRAQAARATRSPTATASGRSSAGRPSTRTAAPTGSPRPTGSPSRRWSARRSPTAALRPARSVSSRRTAPARRWATPSRSRRSRRCLGDAGERPMPARARSRPTSATARRRPGSPA